jgi:hypothetical protein
VRRALLAGYTGRDRAQVMDHVRELEAIGVQRPPRVPMVFDVPPELLTTGTQLLVGVGSDHTDREQEAVDLDASKRACPKAMSR